MKILLLGLLAANTAAATIAWQVQGPIGAGLLLGFAVGSLVSFGGIALQRLAPDSHYNQAMATFAAFFLIKLVLLAAGGMLLRFIEPAAALFDWRAYLVAFGAGVVVIMTLSSVREMLNLREARAS